MGHLKSTELVSETQHWK